MNRPSDESSVEPELLEDIDEASAREAWQRTVDDMQTTGVWYELIGGYKGSCSSSGPASYKLITSRRRLALGRSDFYDAFIQKLELRYGERVFQSDYMAWIDPGNPYRSLLWYIDSAESIDFSLEGIPEGDLRRAAVNAKGLKANRHELEMPFMTLWEINQIVWGPAVAKTRWHLMGSMGLEEARNALGNRVDPRTIVS
jgi:hypothetical protein